MRGREIRVRLHRKTNGARETVTDGELLNKAICLWAAGRARLPALLIIEELGAMRGSRNQMINRPLLLKELIIIQGLFVDAVSENEVAASL